jgi:hypothetical protein
MNRIQELAGERGDLVGLFIEGEVAGVEDHDPCLWQILLIRMGAFNLE